MCNFVFVGKLKLTQNVPTFIFGLSLTLQVRHKTWPWTALKLVQQGRIMLWHSFTSLNVIIYYPTLKTRRRIAAPLLFEWRPENTAGFPRSILIPLRIERKRKLNHYSFV